MSDNFTSQQSNVGTYGGLGLGLATLAYNIYANERSYKKQNQLNRLGQNNFEHQYEIMSRDLQNAGFNPSSLFGASSASSASANSVSTPNFVNSDVPAMIQAISQARLAKSQQKVNDSLVEKNEAEAEKTRSEHDWQSSESEKQRSWQHSEGERQRLFDKWQTEYNAWVKQNEGILERNLHRQLYNASVREKLAFRKLDYQADLNMKEVAHKYNISESVIDNSMKMACQKLLDNNEFIHKFILQKDDQEAQMKLLNQAFANSLSEELIKQDFAKSQDFKKGVMNMLSSFVSIGLLKM